MPGIAKSTTLEKTVTLKQNPSTYFHLRLTTLSPQLNALDEISLLRYLTVALTQSFGITGSAIALDILKIDERDAWVRVQSPDADVLGASLAQWTSSTDGVSLRVMGRASWLGGLETGKRGNGSLWSLER